MVKAGQPERPVITAGTGIGARIVAEDPIGRQADPRDARIVTATLRSILADPAARLAAGSAIKRRFQHHTIENFVNPIIQQLVRVPAA